MVPVLEKDWSEINVILELLVGAVNDQRSQKSTCQNVSHKSSEVFQITYQSIGRSSVSDTTRDKSV